MPPQREINRLKTMLAKADDLADLPDDALFSAVDAISSWSPAIQLHHIALVNDACFRNIEKLFDAAPEKGQGLTWLGRAVLATGRIPRGKGRAPETVIPPPSPDRETVRDALRQTRTGLERIEERVHVLRGLRGRVKHFVFGRLTAPQWLTFARIHTRHHLLIIRDMLRR